MRLSQLLMKRKLLIWLDLDWGLGSGSELGFTFGMRARPSKTAARRKSNANDL